MTPSTDERVRAKIVALHEQGISQREIARQLNLHYITINRWIGKYKSENNLERRPKGPKIRTDDATIIALVKNNSFCSTRAIADNSNVHVSQPTVLKRLKANGFTWDGRQWCQQKNYEEKESAGTNGNAAGISTNRYRDSFDEMINEMEALKQKNLVLKAEKDENNRIINDLKVCHSEVQGKLTELQTLYDNLKMKYDKVCSKLIIYERSGENSELPIEAEVENNNSEGEPNDNSDPIGSRVGIKQEPIEDSLIDNNDYQLDKAEPVEECCSLLDTEFNHQPGIFKSEGDEELYMFRSPANYDMPTHITSRSTMKRQDVLEQVTTTTTTTTTASFNFHHRPGICKLETDEELYLMKTRSTDASSSSNDTNIVINLNDEEGCDAAGATMLTATVTRHQLGLVKENDDKMLYLQHAKSILNNDLPSVKIEEDDDCIEPTPKRPKCNNTSVY